MLHARTLLPRNFSTLRRSPLLYELREREGEPPQFDFGPLPPLEELRSQIAQERREFDAEVATEKETGRSPATSA